MKVDRSMQHASMQPRVVLAGGAGKAGDAMKAADAGKTPRPEPNSWAASGIVALALLFAATGPGVAMTAGHGHSDHTRPHRTAATSHRAEDSSPMRHDHISGRPWMY